MSKANVHKHLTTLQAHRFVTRDGSAYRIRLRFFELGVTVRDCGPLYRESASKVVELADITTQTATLLVPNGEAGVYVVVRTP
jgi:DNA-binding IclR family transcriptional regulator